MNDVQEIAVPILDTVEGVGLTLTAKRKVFLHAIDYRVDYRL
jgi:hypothetical protein